MKPASARSRWGWLLLPWIAAAAMPTLSSRRTTRSAPCLVRVKTRTRSIAGSRRMWPQQRLLGAGVDEDDVLLDPLGRGGDGRHRDLDRIGQVLARRGPRCSSAWWPRRTGSGASAGSIFTMRLRAWMKPRSSIWSASSRTRISTPSRRQRALLDQVDQPARGGDEDVDARGERPLLAADGDAAEHHRGGVGQVAAVIARTIRRSGWRARGSARAPAPGSRGAGRGGPRATGGAGSAARRPRSCRCRSGRCRRGRGPVMAGGIAWAWIGVGAT